MCWGYTCKTCGVSIDWGNSYRAELVELFRVRKAAIAFKLGAPELYQAFKWGHGEGSILADLVEFLSEHGEHSMGVDNEYRRPDDYTALEDVA